MSDKNCVLFAVSSSSVTHISNNIAPMILFTVPMAGNKHRINSSIMNKYRNN